VRLARVWIRSYRCLREMEVELDDYTVLIGPNGSGKSSVLYALDWFFNGGDMHEEDVWRSVSDSGETPLRIEVEVEFADLDDSDRDVLGMYARGEAARFRRSWTDGDEKMIGNSLQGPGFANVRQAGSAAEAKAAYQEAASAVTTNVRAFGGHAAFLFGRPHRCCFSERTRLRSRRWASRSWGSRALALGHRR